MLQYRWSWPGSLTVSIQFQKMPAKYEKKNDGQEVEEGINSIVSVLKLDPTSSYYPEIKVNLASLFRSLSLLMPLRPHCYSLL